MQFYGTVRWCDDDLKNAFEIYDVEVTDEMMDKLRDYVSSHWFTDDMISHGWELIYQRIIELNR